MTELIEEVRYRGLVVDADVREVLLDGRRLHLTHTEFELLSALKARPRVVLTPEYLSAYLSGLDSSDSVRSVEVHVSRLRAKLGETAKAPRFIRTVRGYGYRFEPEVDGSRSVFLAYDENLMLRAIDPDDEPFLGYRPSDIIDTFFVISKFLRPGGTREEALVALQSLIDSGVTSVDTPTVAACADGSSLPVRIQSSLLVDPEGRFAGVEGYVAFL